MDTYDLPSCRMSSARSAEAARLGVCIILTYRYSSRPRSERATDKIAGIFGKHRGVDTRQLLPGAPMTRKLLSKTASLLMVAKRAKDFENPVYLLGTGNS